MLCGKRIGSNGVIYDLCLEDTHLESLTGPRLSRLKFVGDFRQSVDRNCGLVLDGRPVQFVTTQLFLRCEFRVTITVSLNKLRTFFFFLIQKVVTLPMTAEGDKEMKLVVLND